MMNLNKNISNDNLYELFQGIPLNEPSPDFLENLLQRIEKETVKSKKNKHLWMIIGQVIVGVSGILVLPVLVIHLCTIYIPDFYFYLPQIHINLNINLITIGFSILLLLIIDTLLRMRATNRTKHDL